MTSSFCFQSILRVFAVSALLVFAGCGTFQAVGMEQTVVAKGPLKVTPPAVIWNKVPSINTPYVNGEVWTASGLPLDTVIFVSNLNDGIAIYKPARNSNTEYPVFKADMLPNELAELVISSISIQTGAATVDIDQLLPRLFAGADGFDMTYQRTGQDEVKRRGRVAGAVVDGKLHLIMYEAARLYYFDQYAQQAERLIESATLTGR